MQPRKAWSAALVAIQGTWIALCPACHKMFAARKPVALGAMRIHDGTALAAPQLRKEPQPK